MTINRYTLEPRDYSKPMNGQLTEDIEGEYVLYEDHLDLKKENEKLKEENEKYSRLYKKITRGRDIILKFRIIKQIKRNGNEIFIPQYCSFFFWHNFRESLGMEHIEDVRCTTPTEAGAYIEKFIEHQSDINGNKIVSEVVVKEFT